jgi:hypothetical protein
VDSVAGQGGPGLLIQEVEEEGVEPVGYYGEEQREVFVGDEGKKGWTDGCLHSRSEGSGGEFGRWGVKRLSLSFSTLRQIGKFDGGLGWKLGSAQYPMTMR